MKDQKIFFLRLDKNPQNFRLYSISSMTAILESTTDLKA